MNEGLFRKKSMEKISSPEQLDEYIKVSNPSVWMLLFCIIILLLGICVWGIFGRFDTTLATSVISRDGKTVCYVKEENKADITEGMTVRIGKTKYPITMVLSEPVQVTGDFDAYALHIGGLQTGEWVYEIVIDAELNDGIYEAEIITESIAPMSFLFNVG